jgi:hypothetical protein
VRAWCSYQRSLKERLWLEKQERAATHDFAAFVSQVRVPLRSEWQWVARERPSWDGL